MADVEVLRAGLPKRWWVRDGDGWMVGRLWWLVGFRAKDFRQGWDLGILGLGLTEVFFFLLGWAIGRQRGVCGLAGLGAGWDQGGVGETVYGRGFGLGSLGRWCG